MESQNQLKFNSTTDIELTLRQADVIVIDEAQRIKDIGLILKQLVDENIRLNLGKNICHWILFPKTSKRREGKRCWPGT